MHTVPARLILVFVCSCVNIINLLRSIVFSCHLLFKFFLLLLACMIDTQMPTQVDVFATYLLRGHRILLLNLFYPG